MIEAAPVAPVLGLANVSFRNSSGVRNRAGSSAVSPAAADEGGIPVELTGDFGSTQPQLSGFSVHGRQADDTAYGAGDVFEVTFDKPTNYGGSSGGQIYVQSLFRFSHEIAADYTGTWADSSTFEVKIVEPSGALVEQLMTAEIVGSVQNPARTSLMAH